MSVTEYKDGSRRLYAARAYLGCDDLGKKRYRRRKGFTSKRAANLWAAKQKLDVEDTDLSTVKNPRFDAVYHEWYAGYITKVRESTYARTQGMFDNHILPIFGSRRVGDVTKRMLQKAVNLWAKEADRNYKRWFNYVAAVLDYGVRQGYLKANPAPLVDLPKRQPKPGDAPENFWDKAEMTKFFSYIDPVKEPQKYALFRILAFGGLRRGECLGLQWESINFTDNTIRVNATLTQGEHGRQIVQAPKTKAGRRTVPMDPVTMRALKRWRVEQIKQFLARGVNVNSPKQYLFTTRNNTHMYLNQPEKWLKRIEQDHHIQHTITIHGFRASHCSALIAANVNVKEVQARLGHEDPQTTLRYYAHVTEQQGQDAIQKLAGYLGF